MSANIIRVTRIILLVMIIISIPSFIYANNYSVDVNIDNAHNVMEIKGSVNKTGKRWVSIAVYNPDFDFTNATIASFTDVFVYSNQIQTKLDGTFEVAFSIRNNANVGELTVMVGCEGETVPAITKTVYVTEEKVNEFTDMILSSSSPEIIENLLKPAVIRAMLGFDSCFYDRNADNSKIFLDLASLTQKNTLEDMRNTFLNSSIEIAFQNAQKENSIADFIESVNRNGYITKLMNNEIIYEYYKLLDNKENLYLQLINHESTSLSDISNYISEYITYNSFNNLRVSEVAELLQKFASAGLLSIDLNLLNTANAEYVYKQLSGRTFSGVNDIEKTYNNAIRNNPTKEKTSSKGNGGGGFVASRDVQEQVQHKLPVPKEEEIFSDINEVEWARESIYKLVELNILSGYGDKTFRPLDFLKKEEFVKMIVASSGLELISKNLEFKDIEENEWYYSFVSTAYEAGLIKGNEQHVFGIGSPMSRQDAAVVIYRLIRNKNLEFKLQEHEKFNDDALIADYAKEAIYTLRQLNVIAGFGDGSFAPTKFLNRAEAAKLIYNCLNLLDSGGQINDI